MKKLVLFAAVTVLGSSVLGTSSIAQPQLQFGIGPNGPSISVRDPEAERRERWRARREWQERRAWRQVRRGFYDPVSTGSVERCRTTITKTQDQWGRIVEKRVQRCN